MRGIRKTTFLYFLILPKISMHEHNLIYNCFLRLEVDLYSSSKIQQVLQLCHKVKSFRLLQGKYLPQ